MKLSRLLAVWFVMSMVLVWEYLCITYFPGRGIVTYLQEHHFISRFALNTKPGGAIGHFLGWWGLVFIVLTNLYVIRKRFLPERWGSLEQWMNWHIFLGLLGPTMIFFHTAFKVRGIVMVSLVSMIVVVLSGIIGRYFYLQISTKREDERKRSEAFSKRFTAIAVFSGIPENDPKIDRIKMEALQYVGASGNYGLMATLLVNLMADFKLFFVPPPGLPKIPRAARFILQDYAVSVRRIRTIAKFERLMGLWHAFHLPFTIFMYIAAIIHIIASLIFAVSN